MPTLEQIRLQLEHSLADLRMMEIAQRPAEKWEKEKAAFARGEKIQCKRDDLIDDPWDDVEKPGWLDGIEYRIAPAPAWTPKFKVGDTVRVPSEGRTSLVVTVDMDCRTYGLTNCDFGRNLYREEDLESAPWTLSRHLPGFRELADGEEWHRNEFYVHGDLPEGTRPLLIGESSQIDDECWEAGYGPWVKTKSPTARLNKYSTKFRTARPLPALPTGRVALEAKDVPPGSFIRTKEQNSWQAIVAVDTWGLYTVNRNRTTSISVLLWRDLFNWQILRPGETAWEPCSKESRTE